MSEDDSKLGAPKTDKRKSKHRKGGFGDVRWVNSSPNAEDKQWLADHETELVTLFFELVDELGEGSKITLKYDSNTARWVAVYFSDSDGERNAGLALSVRGASPYHACVLLAYTHLVKLSRVWDEGGSGMESEWG